MPKVFSLASRFLSHTESIALAISSALALVFRFCLFYLWDNIRRQKSFMKSELYYDDNSSDTGQFSALFWIGAFHEEGHVPCTMHSLDR